MTPKPNILEQPTPPLQEKTPAPKEGKGVIDPGKREEMIDIGKSTIEYFQAYQKLTKLSKENEEVKEILDRIEELEKQKLSLDSPEWKRLNYTIKSTINSTPELKRILQKCNPENFRNPSAK